MLNEPEKRSLFLIIHPSLRYDGTPCLPLVHFWSTQQYTLLRACNRVYYFYTAVSVGSFPSVLRRVGCSRLLGHHHSLLQFIPCPLARPPYATTLVVISGHPTCFLHGPLHDDAVGLAHRRRTVPRQRQHQHRQHSGGGAITTPRTIGSSSSRRQFKHQCWLRL